MIYLLIWLISFSLEAREPPAQKYKLSICAIFKNEAPYLKEWIEYHRLIGVDHFFLYNNGSLDFSKKILNPYIKEKVVTLIQWPDLLGSSNLGGFAWSLTTQLSAYENALKWMAVGRTKWLVFLDVDEFLVSSKEEKVTDILEQYDKYPGVILSSEYYDASLRGTLPQRKLVVEATEITTPPKQNIFKAVRKTILKPDLCTAFTWPPYNCQFKHSAFAAKVDKHVLRINRYENRMRFQRPDAIKKKLPFDSVVLSESEMKRYLKEGYEIEDQERAIYRYMPDLCKKMEESPASFEDWVKPRR